MLPDPGPIKHALACRCPKCGAGKLYPALFDLRLNERCPSCGLDLSQSDSADGPAVFLIFILGVLLVPAALLVDHLMMPPLWVHVVIWGAVGLGLILATLKPLKAYIIGLQYKHRPWDRTQ